MYRELSDVRTAVADAKKIHGARLWAKDTEIEKLNREIQKLRRHIDSSTGRAPGGSGENPTATGG